MKTDPAIFESYKIRRVYDDQTQTWFFSVVDIIQASLQQPVFQTARKYWNKLKERLTKEESESATNCHRLKLEAADGKKYLTDIANAETLLRFVQSVPPSRVDLYRTGQAFRASKLSQPSISHSQAQKFLPFEIFIQHVTFQIAESQTKPSQFQRAASG